LWFGSAKVVGDGLESIAYIGNLLKMKINYICM
jgi:hypothetical protein